MLDSERKTACRALGLIMRGLSCRELEANTDWRAKWCYSRRVSAAVYPVLFDPGASVRPLLTNPTEELVCVPPTPNRQRAITSSAVVARIRARAHLGFVLALLGRGWCRRHPLHPPHHQGSRLPASPCHRLNPLLASVSEAFPQLFILRLDLLETIALQYHIACCE
eukprot:3467978-Rhodomonas_salina.3